MSHLFCSLLRLLQITIWIFDDDGRLYMMDNQFYHQNGIDNLEFLTFSIFTLIS